MTHGYPCTDRWVLWHSPATHDNSLDKTNMPGEATDKGKPVARRERDAQETGPVSLNDPQVGTPMNEAAQTGTVSSRFAGSAFLCMRE